MAEWLRRGAYSPLGNRGLCNSLSSAGSNPAGGAFCLDHLISLPQTQFRRLILLILLYG